MTTSLTRADHGLIVHEALVQLYEKALDKATLAERMTITAIFDEAIASNVEASGVRVNRPGSVESETTDTKAAVLAFGLRKARTFLINHFRTTDFQVKIQKPGSQMRNIVDMMVYDVLAEVECKGNIHCFCIRPDGKYILSERRYWESCNED